MKETEDDTNKWKDIRVPEMEESILITWPYYPMESTDSIQSL